MKSEMWSAIPILIVITGVGFKHPVFLPVVAFMWFTFLMGKRKAS